MNVVYRQKFNYAKITKHRNYSRLSDKDLIMKRDDDRYSIMVDDMDDLDSHYCDIVEHKGRKFRFVGVNPKTIGTDKEDYSSVRFDSYKPYITQDDKKIKKYYNDQFASIEVFYIERKIIESEDKITVKVFMYKKTRGMNFRFFKTVRYQTIISFNKKTNNIVSMRLSPKFRNIRVNKFSMIRTCLSGIFFPENSKITFYGNTLMLTNFCNAMSNKEFSVKLNETLFNMELKFPRKYHINYVNDQIIFTDESDFTILKPDQEYVSIIYQKIMMDFVKKKEIKVPNTYANMFINFYPTEKFFKKNDRKLVASFLDSFGIKTKSTIKMVHQYPDMDLSFLVTLCRFFGKNFNKYIPNINFKEGSYPKTTFNFSSVSHNIPTKNNLQENINDLQLVRALPDYEKGKIVRLFNDIQDSKNMVSGGAGFFGAVLNIQLLRSVTDHFRMLKQVNEVGIKFNFNGLTKSKFNTEHQELSKLVTLITKGWITEYVYSESTLGTIENQISYEFSEKGEIDFPTLRRNLNFTPIILKSDNDYKEEGTVMHHCVGSYVDQENSLIISIRHINEKNEEERVTCEYNIKTGKRVQAKYFFNNQPPDKFNLTLSAMDSRVSHLWKRKELKWEDKKKVKVKINGVEIIPKKRINRIDRPIPDVDDIDDDESFRDILDF